MRADAAIWRAIVRALDMVALTTFSSKRDEWVRSSSSAWVHSMSMKIAHQMLANDGRLQHGRELGIERLVAPGPGLKFRIVHFLVSRRP